MSLAFATIRVGLLSKTIQASRSLPALYLGGARLYTNATIPTPKEIIVEKVANFEPTEHPYVRYCSGSQCLDMIAADGCLKCPQLLNLYSPKNAS
eukprot:758235-Hanusia_phi.AAC.10